MERKWIIIVAVLGALAIFLTYFYLQLSDLYVQQKQVPPQSEKTQVLIATQDIPQGTAIAEEMVNFKTVPVDFVEPGALKSLEDAVGKISAVVIMSGEQILATKLVPPSPPKPVPAKPQIDRTLAGKMPLGTRAFTLDLDAAASVGGMVKPGDHIDVVASFSNPPITLTLLEDILVLAVGQETVSVRTEEEQTGQLKSVDAEVGINGAITLALSPQQVQKLGVAMEHGKIQLTLRPWREAKEIIAPIGQNKLPAAIDLNSLLEDYIKPPEQVPSVEVIRGLKRELTPLPEEK
jgi:pilus assembly protein CpaB